MKVLVACEESQAVCNEFRKLGHVAYSCDIVPCSGGHPEWHLQQDVIPLLKETWDMIIAFPPCTYLTITGNRWFNIDRYGEKAIRRHRDRKDAVNFLWLLRMLIVIKLPLKILSELCQANGENQIRSSIHGSLATLLKKRTCLWLKGLPKLKPTNIVEIPPRKMFDSGKTMPSWYVEAGKLPKEERSKLRSKTFPGIAKAMAEQWGCLHD
uniref:hypothetical protein n=1 Tax=Alloprevotella sp. TaxID=1872471 RepID=UPI003FEEF7D0